LTEAGNPNSSTNTTPNTVRAAGGVVWRAGDAGVEILVVHRPRYDDWSLPKGKAERGESDESTALREVEEETGLVCHLGPELTTISYTDHLQRPKTVRYWAMTPIDGNTANETHRPNAEVDVVEWLTPQLARTRLSYEREMPVLDAFETTEER
jgi:8-oxo-dGTP diphosphatase